VRSPPPRSLPGRWLTARVTGPYAESIYDDAREALAGAVTQLAKADGRPVLRGRRAHRGAGGPRAWGRLLGYERDQEVRGPWLVETVARAIMRRDMTTVPWADLRLESRHAGDDAARP
jgi:hypothetical protein